MNENLNSSPRLNTSLREEIIDYEALKLKKIFNYLVVFTVIYVISDLIVALTSTLENVVHIILIVIWTILMIIGLVFALYKKIRVVYGLTFFL